MLKKIKLVKIIIDKLIPGCLKFNLPSGSKVIDNKEIVAIIKRLNDKKISYEIVKKKFGEKIILNYFKDFNVESLIEKKLNKKYHMKKSLKHFNYSLLNLKKRKKIYKSV